MDYGGMSHGNQDMGAGLWNAISKAGDDQTTVDVTKAVKEEFGDREAEKKKEQKEKLAEKKKRDKNAREEYDRVICERTICKETVYEIAETE